MTFYFGVIEDRSSDKFRAARYKVRVVGVHSPFKSDIPTEDLPWATPIQNNSAAMSGIGQSPNGYLNGSTVLVIFADADMQIPLIVGSIAGVPSGSVGQFNIYEEEAAKYPPNAPEPSVIKNPDGSTTTIDDSTVIPPNAIVEESPYVGSLTKSDITKMMQGMVALRSSIQGDFVQIDPTHFAIGKYKFSEAEMVKLGYVNPITNSITWTGLNNISSPESFLSTENSGLQDDSQEELFKLNYRSLIDASKGKIGKHIPKEKLAGLMFAAQANGIPSVIELLSTETDTKNYFNETCLQFYKEGYRLFTNRTTEEYPTFDNIEEEASDKHEDSPENTSSEARVLKSKYDVKSIDKSDKNQGFKDPNNQYPIKTRLNESDLPRLASGIKISETIVGEKEENLVKNIPIANSGATWQQSPVPYNAIYPYNNVYQSESGHVMEFDDTKGAERVNIHHKAGTFWEVDNVGNGVERTTGIRTIIVDKDELVYIKGSGHVTIDGDMSLKVNSALHVEITGNANIKAGGNLNFEVGGNMSMKVGGNFNVDAANVFYQSGKSNAVDSFSPDIKIPAPITRKEIQAIELEDTDISKLLANTKVQPPPALISEDETQPESLLTPVESQNELPDDITYQTQLTTNFNIRKVSVGSIGSEFPFKGQYNLTAKQLASNLKGLCLNCLEPIKAQFADKGFLLTSVIRPAGNPLSLPDRVSQHELGQAADMVFTKVRGGVKDRASYVEIATWIRDNILFDQLLLEYRDEGRKVWIHISYKTTGTNRREVRTMNNDKTYKMGLALIE